MLFPLRFRLPQHLQKVIQRDVSRSKKCHLANLCTSRTGATNGVNNVTSASHRPPFLARISLVGSSVGLATPFFAFVGFVRIWRTQAPKTLTGQAVKYVVGVVIGGGSVKLMVDYVIPFFAQNSNLVAPFALANAAASMFWYAVAEATFGLDALVAGRLGLPFLKPLLENWKSFSLILPRLIAGPGMAGPAIGALTAITCPFLWPIAFDLCWNKELKKLVWSFYFLHHYSPE